PCCYGVGGEPPIRQARARFVASVVPHGYMKLSSLPAPGCDKTPHTLQKQALPYSCLIGKKLFPESSVYLASYQIL
ncbi:hypothetical protein NPS29_18565, partial [Pseudomonas putida]|uniref:hypothetical protein n=1 Tax=Pseudomonas putida TaxID=303 RepID=UPI002363B039